jgi:hypothetical protein
MHLSPFFIAEVEVYFWQFFIFGRGIGVARRLFVENSIVEMRQDILIG